MKKPTQAQAKAAAEKKKREAEAKAKAAAEQKKREAEAKARAEAERRKQAATAKAQAEAAKRAKAEADYELGVKLYEQGKLPEAKAAFARVRKSGISLGWWKDSHLKGYMAKITDAEKRKLARAEAAKRAAGAAKQREAEAKRRLQSQSSAYAQAEALFKAGKYAEAKTAFDAIARSRPLGSEKRRAQIAAYLSQCERKMAEASRAREKQKVALGEKYRAMYQQAKRLYEAREFERAKPLFLKVQKSGIRLGFFGNMRLRRYLRTIDSDIAKKKRAVAAAEAKKRQQLVAFAAAEQAYRQGHYEQAKEAFLKVQQSGVNIGPAKTAALRSYLKTADAKIAEQRAAKLEAIEKKLESGFLEARIAEIEKKMQENRRRRAEALATYDQAVRDYKAGKLEAAQKGFATVRASNVDIGEKRRGDLARYLDDVNARLRELQSKRAALLKVFHRAQDMEQRGELKQARDLYTQVRRSKVKLGEKANADLQTSLARVARLIAERERIEAERRAKALAAFRNGESLYAQKKYREARQAFQSISSQGAYLGSQRSRELTNYLAKIEEAIRRQEAEARRLAELRARAKETFAKAQMLYREGKLEEAQRLFDDLKASKADLGAAENARLQQLAAEVDRKVAPIVAKRKQFHRVYDEAVHLHEDGKLVEAKAKFQEVKASGVNLGPEAMGRLARYLGNIDTEIREQARRREEQRRRAEELRKKMLALYTYGQNMFSQGKFTEAKDAFEKVQHSGAKLPQNVVADLPKRIEEADLKIEEQKAQIAADARLDMRKAVALCEAGLWSDAKVILERIVRGGTAVEPTIRNDALRRLKDIDLHIRQEKARAAAERERCERSKQDALRRAATFAAQGELKFRQGKLAEAKQAFATARSIKLAADLNVAVNLLHAGKIAAANKELAKLARARNGLAPSDVREFESATAKLRSIKAQQQAFDRGAALLREENKLDEADAALRRVRDSEVELGPQRKALLRAYLAEIAERKRLAEHREKLRRQRKAQTLEHEYSLAEKLFSTGKLEEARAKLIQIRSTMKENPTLPLSWRVKRGVPKYLARIDDALRERAERQRLQRKALELLAIADRLKNSGQLEKALNAYKEADRLRANLPKARATGMHATIRRLEKQLAAERAAKEKQRRELAKAYDEALRAWKKQDYEKAKPLFLKVAKASPDVVGAKKKDAEQKLASVDRLSAEKREREEAQAKQLVRAKALFDAGNLASARSAFADLEKMGPLNSEMKKIAHDYLAKIDNRVAELERAKREQELAKRRQQQLAALQQAEDMARQGQYDLAQQKLAAIRGARISLGRENDARLVRLTREVAEKLRAKQEAEQRKTREALTLYETGMSLFRKGRLMDAKSKLQAALDSNVDLGSKRAREIKDTLRTITDRLAATAKARKAQMQKLTSAEKAMNAGDYAGARRLIEEIQKTRIDLGEKTNARVASLLREAKQNYADQQAARAEAERERQEKLHAKFRQGRDLYDEGKFAQALKLLDEVAKSNVDLSWLDRRWLTKHLASCRIEARKAAERERIQAQREKEAAALLQQARAALKNKQYQKALELLNRLKRDFRDTETYKRSSSG